MTRWLLAAVVVVFAGGSGCYGGCPLLPAKAAAVTVAPAASCLALHVHGSEASDTGGSRCVDGVTVVGVNSCAGALTLSPPSAGVDGGAAGEARFEPGAAVRFDLDEARGVLAGGKVTWSVPARLGAQDVTLTVVVPRS